MRRAIPLTIAAAVLAFAPASSQAQGLRFHGIPGSATSPGPNGELHGIPSSVTSPTPDNRNQGRFFDGTRFNQQRRFDGRFRDQHGRRMVVVPVYVPGYSLPYYMYEPEPVAEERPTDNPPPEPPARTIFERRSTTVADDSDDTADSRYGEHYLDSREERHRKPAKAEDTDEKVVAKASTEKPVPETPSESLPSTILIFKDGHRSEIHDYAIVGDNLFDLGTVHVMKKIPLAMLDLSATRKENEQNGVDFRLP